MRIDHVQIAIPEGEEDKARRFWCDLVGMTELEKPEALKQRGGLWLQVGTTELHLGVEAPFRPARKAHPGFALDNIDTLAQALIDAGHSVRWAEDIPGRHRFFTDGPFGNRIEFLQSS